jgi:hypothetical protein
VNSGGDNGFHLFLSWTDQTGTPNWWSLDLATANKSQLAVGDYEGATRYPFNSLAGTNGLDISGEGRGLNTIYGDFIVSQVSYDASGNISSLAATFDQYATYNGVPDFSRGLHGEVYFNCAPPTPTPAPAAIILLFSGASGLVIVRRRINH